MKTKVLISFAVTAKLICAFVFAYADCWFSHAAAQMMLKMQLVFFSCSMQVWRKNVGNISPDLYATMATRVLIQIFKTQCRQSPSTMMLPIIAYLYFFLIQSDYNWPAGLSYINRDTCFSLDAFVPDQSHMPLCNFEPSAQGELIN